ncbi:MAG: 2-amino-4-hydroxy-6-hydroxymethyldihydropteridine diphosphokinase [Bacteroidaceae bacterium]
MKRHECLLCIGSNEQSEANLILARKELVRLFPDIHFGKEALTIPLFFVHNHNLFRNQLGKFSSELSIESIQQHLKQIEKFAGRQPEDKAQELVKLDIDLLIYNHQILKPKYLERDYIKELICLMD